MMRVFSYRYPAPLDINNLVFILRGDCATPCCNDHCAKSIPYPVFCQACHERLRRRRPWPEA